MFVIRRIMVVLLLVAFTIVSVVPDAGAVSSQASKQVKRQSLTSTKKVLKTKTVSSKAQAVVKSAKKGQKAATSSAAVKKQSNKVTKKVVRKLTKNGTKIVKNKQSKPTISKKATVQKTKTTSQTSV